MVVVVATIVSVVVGACISSRGVLLAGCWHAGGWHLGLLACLHRLLACLAGLQPCCRVFKTGKLKIKVVVYIPILPGYPEQILINTWEVILNKF